MTERGYGPGWQALSRRVIAEQPWCSNCGHEGSRSNPLTADHVTPLAAGGTNDLTNLRTLCRTCNSRRRRDAPR